VKPYLSQHLDALHINRSRNNTTSSSSYLTTVPQHQQADYTISSSLRDKEELGRQVITRISRQSIKLSIKGLKGFLTKQLHASGA